jgi:hypothetical protein
MAEEQTVFPEFVKDLLTAEEKRRDSLEARGLSVITVSGTLVTLLLAFTALVTKRQEWTLGSPARELLIAAVAAFLLSAVLAISTYAPRSIRMTDAVDLAETLPALWSKGADFARQKTTATRLEELRLCQTVNDWKARALLAAIAVQVIAVMLVAAAVIAIL